TRCRRCSRAAIASGPVPPRRRTGWSSTRCSTCPATPIRGATTTMSRLRAALWSVSIGVLSVVVAAALVWLLQQNRAAVGFLYGSVFVVCVVSGLVVELPRGVGAAGGAVAAVLVAAILGVTIAAAPLGPGAQRPGLPDLLWKPLFALIAA